MTNAQLSVFVANSLLLVNDRVIFQKLDQHSFDLIPQLLIRDFNIRASLH